MRKYSTFFRLTAVLLVLIYVLPSAAMAAAVDPVTPQASAYLASYNAYVCPMGGGELQLWFNAMGDGIVDELGSLRIMLYESTDNENFTWKKTYLHDEYDNMLAYNDYYHASYVTYQGIVGRYYKFYICIWGGKNGKGDTRYFWTSSDRAT